MRENPLGTLRARSIASRVRAMFSGSTTIVETLPLRDLRRGLLRRTWIDEAEDELSLEEPERAHLDIASSTTAAKAR